MRASSTEVMVHWSGPVEGNGRAQLGSSLFLPLSAPVGSGGNGRGTNPEELFAAAAASCQAITIAGLLERVEVRARDIRVKTKTSVEVSNGLRLLRVHHRVWLALAPGASPVERDRARVAVERAGGAGLIARATQGNVEVTTELEIAA